MRIATSVHISRVPEVRAAVLDRTLHRATCGCGHKVAADVAFTYVDVERGHWVQVEPMSRRAAWAAVESETMRALTRGLDLTSPIISGLAETARRRVVFGLEELREKLVVWDAGIDDGLVECLKLRAWIDEPSLMRAPLLVDHVTEDGGLEIARIDEQSARRFELPASWVDRALDEHPSLAARYPELFRGGFVNTLRLIAMVVLVLAGCSQPHAREAPPPRPRDAAAQNVTDSALIDAAVPIDAPAPADAARYKILWQALRDRDEGAANVRVAARAIQLDYKGSETSIVLDRGTRSGVHAGWKGIFLDDHDYPVLDVFEITDADTERSRARIRANPDQVNRTTRNAVLWDPTNREAEPVGVR